MTAMSLVPCLFCQTVLLLMITPSLLCQRCEFSLFASVHVFKPVVCSKTLIVSTFDGQLSALNFDGKDWIESWARRFDDKPLLSSTIQDVRVYMDGLPYRMIPALDGTLYTFDGRHIAQLPISAESLRRSSHKIGDGFLAAGSSDSQSFGIRLSDGLQLYGCTADGCQQNVENDSTSDEMLIVQKQSHGVRALDPQTGKEKWNIFTSEFKISLSQNDTPECLTSYDNRLNDEESVMLGLSNSELVFVSSDNGTIRSKRKFSSPIAAAWLVKDGHISVIDPFAPASPADDVRGGIYIGQAFGQLYIQPSLNSNKQSLQAIEVPPNSEAKAQITFKPSKSTRPAPTTGREVAVVLEKDLELGSGYIYHEKCDVIENEYDDLRSNTSFDDFLPDETDSSDHTLVVSLWYWWKEMLGITFTLAILLNVIAHYLKNRVQDCLDCESVSDDSNECPEHSRRSRISSHRTASPNRSISDRTLSASFSSSVVQPERPFISRFETEYENIQCRGKGGFGVVFEARKKLESVSYAVKRIRMPSKPELQEKVMREVKALANMHHQNIVRYYTSWTEEPPIGWQVNFDRRILSSHPHDDCLSIDSKSSVSAFSTREQEIAQNPGHNKQLIDSICEEDSLRLAADDTHTSQDSYVVFAEDAEDQKPESLVAHETETWQRMSPDTCETRGERRHRRPAVPKTFLYIQMELCAKQTLREWLQENNTSSQRDRGKVFAIFRQIVEAVNYVHSSGLMHRDLKPSNIFFSSDGAVKVGDFGLVTAAVESCDTSPAASSADPSSLTPLQTADCSSSSGTLSHTDNVGTFLYMSPDQLAGVSYSNKVDIYSLGVILYELLVPFRTEMERLHTLKHVRDLSFPHSFCKKFAPESELLIQMLAVNPTHRPSAGEILTHDVLLANVSPSDAPPSRHRTISITDSGDVNK